MEALFLCDPYPASCFFQNVLYPKKILYPQLHGVRTIAFTDVPKLYLPIGTQINEAIDL